MNFLILEFYLQVCLGKPQMICFPVPILTFHLLEDRSLLFHEGFAFLVTLIRHLFQMMGNYHFYLDFQQIITIAQN